MTSGPAGNGHLPFLDGWRGMAILLVLIGHFASFAPDKLGAAGVDSFFVLSGRLMAEILIVRRVALGTFLARRASRIVPALAVYVLLLMPALLASAHVARADSLLGAAGALFFFHNYLPQDRILAIFEHCWSLAVEEHSYLLLAAIALLLAAAAILNGLRLGLDPDRAGAAYIYWRTDVRAASVFLSFAAWLWAERFVRTPGARRFRWASPLFLALGLAIETAAGLPAWLRFSAGTGSLVLAVATLDIAPARVRAFFASRPLTWLGLVSYSLYLWQQPFLLAWHSGAPLLLCVAATFACALLSFHWVERPARASLNRQFAERRSAIARALPARPALRRLASPSEGG
jgi:peptidoglycan/LPS O-acetylase OafA/YrhL